ncbi:MAG TPA: MFS transporter, partial [Firmicutes bacterium]|nr:MFS transporter [Bacillota bacterium]
MVNQTPQEARLLRRRWLVWGMLAFSFLIVFFHRVGLAVVADQLMAEFHLSAAALGNLGAVYFYIYTAMQIPSGALADTLGPRLTASMGTLVAGIGSMVFGWAPTPAVAMLGRFLVGLGVSVVFISLLKIQTEWFRPREFATITGLTSLVGNSGNALAATPLALLVAAIGWRNSFVAVGVLGSLVAIGCWLVVRNRPADLGLSAIDELEAREAGGRVAAAAPPPGRVALGRALAYVGRGPYTLPLFVAAFGLNGSLMVISAMWGVPYLMQVYGLSRGQASLYTLSTAFGVMLA